jgi:hypothetical protein
VAPAPSAPDPNRNALGQFVVGNASEGGRHRLIENPEIVRMVVSYIRAGAFDWVACEAAGIHQRTFLRAMQQGDEDDAAGLDTSASRFWREVRHARAEARVAAEVEEEAHGAAQLVDEGSRPGAAGRTGLDERRGRHRPCGRQRHQD